MALFSATIFTGHLDDAKAARAEGNIAEELEAIELAMNELSKAPEGSARDLNVSWESNRSSLEARARSLRQKLAAANGITRSRVAYQRTGAC